MGVACLHCDSTSLTGKFTQQFAQERSHSLLVGCAAQKTSSAEKLQQCDGGYPTRAHQPCQKGVNSESDNLLVAISASTTMGAE
eukprot:1311054-Amphidinium_carterae.1